MNLLIIDDSKDDRIITLNYLEKIDTKKTFSIDESEDLKTGLEKIKTNSYDVILLDLKLPETEGTDTIEAVMNCLKEIGKKIPVIVLTGLDDYKISAKAFQLGVKDLLFKGEAKTKEIARSLTFATYSSNLPKKFSLFKTK